ncbi:MAG: ABC transporter permease [Deinococcaceae bacterium]
MERQRPLTLGKGGLSLFQILAIAWRAILANPLRSALTTLGVIIGVAAVIALTAIGAGSTSGITKQLEGLGTNLLTLSSARGGGGPSLVRSGNRQTITMDDVNAVKVFDPTSIVNIAPTLQSSIQVKYGDINTTATVLGTWPEYTTVRNTPVDQGRFISQEDIDGRKRVVVIGYSIVQDLFGDINPLDQKIKLSGISFTVVGTLPDKGNSGFQSPNSQIIIPLSTYQQRIGRQESSGPQTVQNLYIQGVSKDNLSVLQERLTDLIAQRHKIDDPEGYDFNIQSQADALSSLNSVTQTLTLLLAGIASISLVVGGIGIMNIMLVSVTERTREIGIRKALGARPRDILTQFLVEAFALSIGGGLLGVLFGVGIALLSARFMSLTPIFTFNSIVLAFGFSAGVGVFFGYYPATRAARLDPVDALRYE